MEPTENRETTILDIDLLVFRDLLREELDRKREELKTTLPQTERRCDCEDRIKELEFILERNPAMPV